MPKISILLARQRSGTGALSGILDQQQSINYIGEVMHDDHLNEENNFFNFYLKKVVESPSQALPSARTQQLKDYFSFLKELYPESGHVIVDIKYRSLHHFNGLWHGPREVPKLLQISREMGLGIIHLTRKNFIKTYVSGLLADMNKVWHAEPDTKIDITTVKLDCVKLFNYLNATRNEVEFVSGFLKNSTNVLHLEYEDIFDENGLFNTEYEEKIVRFYGLSEFKRAAPQYVKQTSDQLQEVIENFEEVSTFLKNTVYSWMLE